MPFKFGFKRARRYNVSSKNSYVVCIHLLDNSLIECTLTSESSGRECLDNISQRIELCQPDCFGLRFVNKKLQFRWIELDKPLKKQLDKRADSSLLYFGVMFYIPNAHRIEDEMTRYQYYLQLKMDVIDGKLQCTPEQAVLLASYSVQAEFGDHEPERHTAEYLKDFILLPRTMTTDDRALADLTLEIVSTHHGLQGLPPAVAELQYIVEAQRLDGYGVEYYPAKGANSTEVQLGTSFLGMVVKHRIGQPIECFKWTDISNVTHSRRMFGVTSSLNNHTIHFQMDDPDIAKYLYKIATLHHTFYSGSRQNSLYGSQVEVSPEPTARGPLPDVQDVGTDVADGPRPTDPVANNNQTSNVNPAASLYQDPAVIVDPQRCTSVDPNYPDPNAFSADQPIVDMQYDNGHIYQMMVGADIPTVPPAVPPVVASPHQHYVQNTKYANNRSGAAVALPAYRPSPAYDTVMRQRLDHLQPAAMPDAQQVIDPRHQDLAGNLHLAQVYMHPETMAYSQPEIGRVPPPYMQYLAQMGRGVDGYQSPDVSYGVDRMSRPVDRACSLIIYPTYGAAPDVTSVAPPQSQYSASEHFVNETLMNHHYKPPPPYPHYANSTPDLATLQTSRSNLNRSPDLVSRKNIGGATAMLSLVHQSHLDQSVDNLALDTHNLNIRHAMAPQHAWQPSAGSDANSPSGQPPVEIFILDPPMQYPSQHAPLQYSQSDVTGMERRTELRLEQAAVHPGLDFRSPVMPFQSSPESIVSTHASDVTDSSVGQNMLPEGAGNAADEYDDVKTNQWSMGPMKVAALNGLTAARGSILDLVDSESRIPKDDRRTCLEGKLEEDQVFVEFETIPKKRVRWNCGIAELEENNCRNRFHDVLPYDDCRVKLKPSKDNAAGYINASHLKVDVAGEQWWYIAAQAPLPGTVNDFWQMLWEQDVHVIAMLTAIEEAGKTKCHLYWPRQPGPQNKVRYGDFVVTLQFSTSSRCYITRVFNVRDMRSGQDRLMWHLQYTDWPDHGCPEDAQAFLTFLDELESVRRHVSQDTGCSQLPTLVHCSAGVGRTGVLILVELVKACLQHNQTIDIPAMLETLRMQRMHLVQTISQYRVVYKTLVQYLKNLRLI